MPPHSTGSHRSPGPRSTPWWGLVFVLVLAYLILHSGGGLGPDPVPDVPRSVILLVGDGMGPQEIGLFLDVQDARGAPESALARLIREGERSVLRTGSADSAVTDSAASATAFATGVDTDNGRVGTDPSGAVLRTCLEDARDSGRMTALITSTRVTHATPASFAAHVDSRGDENTIARQLLASEVDILLGGGGRHFLGGVGGQTLAAEIEAAGYTLVRDAEQLAAAPAEGKLLGLFAGSDLPFRLDRDGDEGEEAATAAVPRLPVLARAALDRLDDARGYFLMIEGGRIDHAGHMNDAAALYGEMLEFDETLAVVLEHTADRPEVAVLVLADHETGGLSLTYRPGSAPSSEDLRALAAERASVVASARREVSAEEAERVFGTALRQFYPGDSWSVAAPALERSAARFVAFATQGHTATPVWLLHTGAGERFDGLLRHTDVGLRLREWMSVSPEAH